MAAISSAPTYLSYLFFSLLNHAGGRSSPTSIPSCCHQSLMAPISYLSTCSLYTQELIHLSTFSFVAVSITDTFSAVAVIATAAVVHQPSIPRCQHYFPFPPPFPSPTIKVRISLVPSAAFSILPSLPRTLKRAVSFA